jgi:hypothetical protein
MTLAHYKPPWESLAFLCISLAGQSIMESMNRSLLICAALACSIGLGCFAGAEGCCSKEAPKTNVTTKKNAVKKTTGKKAVAKKTTKTESGSCGHCSSDSKTEKKGEKHQCICKDPFLSEARKMEQEAAKAEAKYKKSQK